MGSVYEEFENELAAWRRQYAGQPRREMVRLFLLALEREELVSVGYRESVIVRRLQAMPVPDEVRELIRHALLWAWKDEEMHAIYIRGAILKLGAFRLRVRAFLHQAAGAVGGWSTSVRQHAHWRQAPLSRSVATLITWAGTVLGKVPQDVREHLRYGPFRNFCLFNVDAEKTAWLCWERVVELAQELPDMEPAMCDDFRRVVADEDRHARVFQILADALDGHDRLVSSVTPERLAEQFRAVSEFFLPRSLREASVAGNPLGRGGRVYVRKSMAPGDKHATLCRLLDDAGLPRLLAERARALGKPVAELRVAVKATFMLGYHRKDLSPLTDPALLDELARVLNAHGCTDVAVLEARVLYDHFFQNRTVRDVAHYFKLESPRYRIVDVTEEQVAHSYLRGMGQYTVSRTWKEADFRINFGKMRSHPVEMGYLSLANLEGLGARCEEFLFAERQAQRSTAIAMLAADFPPHLSLLDAHDAVPDGLVGMLGCPRPKLLGRLYAAEDPLALDLVAARQLGAKQPLTSSILRAAVHWFGDPTGRTEVVGLDEPVSGWRSPYHTDLSTFLSFLAYPVYEFGSGRGALFVPEMDTAAFPPIGQEGPLLRLGRRFIQWFLGLRFRR